MQKRKIVGVIAATAALMFVAAPMTSALADSDSSKVKCYGVNSCKHKSKCKTSQNACKGKNSCKKKGFVMKTKKQCEKMGGSLEETK